MIVDMHSHSIHSDGLWTVPQLLQEAERRHIKVYAVTDHDTLAGSIDAAKTNEEMQYYSGILLSGVEISTRVAKSKIHMLAYFPTFNIFTESSLLQHLDEIRRSRFHRMKLMVEAANELGFDVTIEEVLAIAQEDVDEEDKDKASEVLARPHLARLLAKKKYVDSVDQAFQNYLADGKPLYRKRSTLTIEQWIVEVKKLQGVLIWAHPLHYHNNNLKQFQEALTAIEQLPIDGVEFVYNYEKKYVLNAEYKEKANALLATKIVEKNWVITAGGDFHGDSGCLGELELDPAEFQRFYALLT